MASIATPESCPVQASHHPPGVDTCAIIPSENP
jgi:hypothetical protein